MSEPHPKFSPEIALAAARELAAELARINLIDPDQIEASAKDIAKHAKPEMDGYAIARKLDTREYWDCDLELANALDGFGGIYLRKMAVMA